VNLYRNSILDAIYCQAGERPSAVALQEAAGRNGRTNSITYSDLVRQVDTLALNLVRGGMQKGDRALLLVRPGIPVIVLAMSLLRAGASLVLADIGMGKEVFESRMRMAQPRWVFAETILLAMQRIGPLRRAMRARGVEIPEIGSWGDASIVNVGPRVPFLGCSLSLRDLQRPLVSDEGRRTKDEGSRFTDPSSFVADDEETQTPDDEALVVFTSGTTGLPRGVTHSIGSISATVEMISSRLHATPADVVYASSFHLVMPALSSGGLAILPPHKFDAEKFLRDLQRYNVTLTFGIPGDFEKVVALCHQTNQRLPDTLAYIMLGSAPVPAGFLKRLKAVLPEKTEAWDVYGMTEMLPVCDVSLTEKLAHDGPGDMVGRPLPGVCVRLAEDGELVVSGPNLYSHVLGNGNPPATEHFTGDIALIDEQGRVVLTGRKKDMIIKQEHNIYPALFEPTILRIPGVHACALIGVYHDGNSDEEIVLVIEKEAGTDQAALERTLRRELLDGPNSIDTYAQPDRIVFAPLPRSGRSNKVDKKRLREMLYGGTR
jgi:acyl-CoA synthetase (AMP-forming)/AMP-acid ligase II